MSSEDRRLTGTPMWVNPCGLAADYTEGESESDQLQDDQLLHQIWLQASTALSHALTFRDAYVKDTFQTDFNDWHSNWKEKQYEWLPKIPKQLGEELDQGYLSSLELDTALLDAYEYMQKYAVGLEQVVWDQEDRGREFHKQFKETVNNLRAVLCELQVALAERGVTLRPDVTRAAMSSSYRTETSDTFRDLRDWMIFRDYMNGLEYVVQVFAHLRESLKS